MIYHGKNFRGIINKAKEMIFDNTGTDLISTNAEDAIKEVNSKSTWTYIDTITLSQSGDYQYKEISDLSSYKEILCNLERSDSPTFYQIRLNIDVVSTGIASFYQVMEWSSTNYFKPTVNANLTNNRVYYGCNYSSGQPYTKCHIYVR